MMNLLKLFGVVSLLFLSGYFFAQNYSLNNTFHTDNSKLPSNLIFDLEQDDKGFLWIATEDGLSRFDGLNFFNYTIKNGLPSNSVLQVVKDKSGKIWAICYKQPPSFFDEKNNRFITQKNLSLEKKCNAVLQYYFNEKGNIIFYKAPDYLEITSATTFIVKQKPTIFIDKKQIAFQLKNDFTSTKPEVLYRKKSNEIVFLNFIPRKSFIAKNSYFIYKDDKIHKFSHFKTGPFTFKEQSLNYPEGIKWHKLAYDKLYLITNKNYFEIIDLETFSVEKKIRCDEKIKCAFLDTHQNLWSGTFNEGIQLFNTGKIRNLTVPDSFNNKNFNTVTANEKGEIFAGNFNGEILKTDGITTEKIKTGTDFWIRKILFFGKTSLVVTDKGYSINWGKVQDIKDDSYPLYSLKKATKANDSIALICTISGAFRLNILKNTYQKINFPNERIMSFSKIKENEFYVISSSGFYTYDLKKNTYQRILEKYNCTSGSYDGNLFFAATTLGEIYIFKNKKLIKIIPNSNNLPENISQMEYINKKLWIGGRKNLSILSYSENNGIIEYDIKKIGKNDGLTSNAITDISSSGRNVLVATENGISVVPDDIQILNFEIRPEIIYLKINQEIKPIADVYDLKSDQNNISIAFSGVELSGHFKNFQYKINDSKKWSNLSGNILNLELSGGKNVITIRATDKNNYISLNTKSVTFNISIPFYKSIWFWTLVSGVFFGGIFAFYGRWRFLKQQEFYRHKLDLENQQNKITADLHDDLGATLSSLQINSAIAQKLMEKDQPQTKKILQKIEHQAKEISENIGNIIWSMKPGKNEFMSLSTRIKNFASEILGDTGILYTIKIDSEIDLEITDFTLRKNLILICKEALNNIAKYSLAKDVQLSLHKTNSEYILKISDNGIGFDHTKTTGNGLQNMKKRTEEMNGKFEILADTGTHITIYVPKIRD